MGGVTWLHFGLLQLVAAASFNLIHHAAEFDNATCGWQFAGRAGKPGRVAAATRSYDDPAYQCCCGL
jgi:hypothetical protein